MVEKIFEIHSIVILKSIMLIFILFQLAICSINAELIPRKLLFGEPKYLAVTLSPDGQRIGFLAPNEHGISNIFIKCVTCRDAEPVTFENYHISNYYWTGIPDILLFEQDNNGDENTKLFKVNITEPHSRHTISDRPGVKAMIIDNNCEYKKMLIGLNDESPAFHNVYEFDLITNQMLRIFHNERFPAQIVVDNNQNIRLVTEESDDGSMIYYRPSPSANLKNLTSNPSEWIKYLTVRPEDRILTNPIGFSKDNRQIYWLAGGPETDLGQLIVNDFDHPEQFQVLYRAIRTAIADVAFHPVDKNILLVTEFYHKPELYVANQTIMQDVQYLVNLRPNASPMIKMSRDFNTWLVTFNSDTQPPEYFVYDRVTKIARFLFSVKPELAGKQLNRMIGLDFDSRDGLKLQAYLSLPSRAQLLRPDQVQIAEDRKLAELGALPAEPQKLVLLVHGGPKARDFFGFSPMNAWLTDRNYAVLQVNFRGSVGFGKNLTNAGNGEWGRRMHEDLLDAVEFVINRKIAKRNEIAIMGASYGGYATLVGLTFTPDVFACGIDIVGPSNLITLLEAVPPYWLGFYSDIVKMLGADKDTEEGRSFLKSRSPLFFANKVRKPLLMVHGSNDPRVRQSESDQFVNELKKNNIPVQYLVFPDEGHGPRKPENVMAMSGVVEGFLKNCLNGDAEEFKLGQYNSSAIMMNENKPLISQFDATQINSRRIQNF